MKLFTKLLRDEQGATAIEYGLIAALIAVAAITAAGGSSVFTPMFNSMRRITADEATRVVPRELEVVTASPADTVQTLASRMAFDSAQVERFRVLNGLLANAQVVPGEKYKIVVRAG